MLEKYRKLFDMYLSMCEQLYDSEHPYENLEECIKSCEKCKWQLSGMLTLMEHIGEIDENIHKIEWKKILEKFSSIRICNAYMESGEVMVFVNR